MKFAAIIHISDLQCNKIRHTNIINSNGITIRGVTTNLKE